MPQTFQDLGISFPLWAAPVEEATEFEGLGSCSLCRGTEQPCFRLGIGTDLVIPCSTCGAHNALDADYRTDVPCRVCATTVPFPPTPDTPILVCYTCLRAGKAALTKDTEFGMVRWEETLTGITHGAPNLHTSQFPLVPLNDGWVGARVPQEQMWELLRTPRYITWQGEHWLFCCSHPMIYQGAWDHQAFNAHAPDGNGEALFNAIVEDPLEDSWETDLQSSLGVYVFQCQTCQRLRAHWDAD